MAASPRRLAQRFRGSLLALAVATLVPVAACKRTVDVGDQAIPAGGVGATAMGGSPATTGETPATGGAAPIDAPAGGAAAVPRDAGMPGAPDDEEDDRGGIGRDAECDFVIDGGCCDNVACE